ncbi:transmembrane protein 207 isoform X2 [Empidonax traillii]|uniref:transmembrane protein 207 isoform X2 n=1 Tax=Empidonax traillii TaxID=164674 RepID=UPI000FFDA2E3|nr:transmembrane protein 207 isoform X2 [Empidonax traillii]
MWRPGALCFTSWITGTGVLCLTFFQLADSELDCELGERCVRQSNENFSSWYVWFLMLFFLALLLSCGICCCLQCWLKQRSCLPHQRTVAVFALSSSDTFCVVWQLLPGLTPLTPTLALHALPVCCMVVTLLFPQPVKHLSAHSLDL